MGSYGANVWIVGIVIGFFQKKVTWYKIRHTGWQNAHGVASETKKFQACLTKNLAKNLFLHRFAIQYGKSFLPRNRLIGILCFFLCTNIVSYVPAIKYNCRHVMVQNLYHQLFGENDYRLFPLMTYCLFGEKHHGIELRIL